MTVEEYAKQHTDIYYCEAVILPDGGVEDAIPSHQMKLLSLEGVPNVADYFETSEYKELHKRIPMSADPMRWMCEDLGVVCTYYASLMVPLHYTSSQVESIVKLIETGCIAAKPRIEVAKEKSHTILLQNLDPDYRIPLFALIHERDNAQRKLERALQGVRRKSETK